VTSRDDANQTARGLECYPDAVRHLNANYQINRIHRSFTFTAVKAANTSVDYYGKQGYSRNFVDNRLQTCDWFYEGNSFKIRLNKRQHINKLTLISPKNYKGVPFNFKKLEKIFKKIRKKL
jgi:hypothetical protein